MRTPTHSARPSGNGRQGLIALTRPSEPVFLFAKDANVQWMPIRDLSKDREEREEVVLPDRTITFPPEFIKWCSRRKARVDRAFGVIIWLCRGSPRMQRMSTATLAKVAGMCKRSMNTCLAELEQGGWIIRRHRRKNGTLWGWTDITVPHLLGDD